MQGQILQILSEFDMCSAFMFFIIHESTAALKLLKPASHCPTDQRIGWKIGWKIAPVGELALEENYYRRWSVVVWHVMLGPTIGSNFSVLLRNLARQSGSRIETIALKQSEQIHPIEPMTVYPQILLQWDSGFMFWSRIHMMKVIKLINQLTKSN